MRPFAPIAVIAMVLAGPAAALRCELDGVAINTDNGSTTAGRSGILKCYRPDGRLQREQELRNGQYRGLDKRYDDDGSVSEREVNANGNTEGRARERYANGQLKHEAIYENGAAVGLSKSWFPDGRIAALRFTGKAGGPTLALVEYNAQGQLTELRCGPRPLLEVDRQPCGFGAAATTALFDARGERRAELTLREGRTLAAREFDRAGRLASGYETTADGRIERRYHENGQVALESVVAHDYRIADTEWYMNGQVKSKTTREPAERAAHETVERFRDTGVIESRAELIGARRTHEQTFDERGAPKEELFYDDEGALKRRRAFGAGGAVTVDEALYPDGSRKSILGTPQIAR